MDLEATRASDAQAVAAALAGDQNAFGRLFGEHFDRTYDVAYRILRDKEQAAEVAQDTFLAAWKGLSTLEDPASFGGWVLRISRNRALNRLSRERRSVALGDEVTAAVIDHDAPDPEMERNIAAEQSSELLWAASAALGERDASVLDLHLRHGLSGTALAEELGVNPNNANQILHAMKGRLENALRAFVLWRNGNPNCAELRKMLARQDEATFGTVTARMIRRHLKACGTCDAEQRRQLAPAAMFSAVPVLVAPLTLRTQAAGALVGAGVPMGDAAPTAPDQAATGMMDAVDGSGSPIQPSEAGVGARQPGSADGGFPRKLAALVGGGGLVLLAVLAFLLRGGDEPPDPVVSPTTQEATTSTSTTGTTSTTTPPPPTSGAPGTDPPPGAPDTTGAGGAPPPPAPPPVPPTVGPPGATTTAAPLQPTTTVAQTTTTAYEPPDDSDGDSKPPRTPGGSYEPPVIE